MSSTKISDFIDGVSFQSTDLLNIVRSGTNFKVPASALSAFLGVTGTISPKGSGIQILNQPDSTTNEIRSIEATGGILAQLSASNSVQIKSNFANTAGGVSLIDDVTASQIKFRSIEAGPQIAVSLSGDNIQISVVSAAVSSKTVVVSVEADFPTPSGGVIVLADDTDYLLVNDIATVNRFIVGFNTVLRATDERISTLTYTGTGKMFTGINANFGIKDIALDMPNGGLFDLTHPAGTGATELSHVVIKSCVDLGIIDEAPVFSTDSINYQNIITKGYTFTGASGNIRISASLAVVNGGDFIDLGTATFDGISIESTVGIVASGANFLKGATGSANINIDAIGVMLNTRVQGAGTAAIGITISDARWLFSSNSPIGDTRTDGLLSFDTPTTTVLAASTPKLITGPWTVERVSQMTGTVGGRLIYSSDRPTVVPVVIALSLEPVSGTNKAVNIYIAKNGSIESTSKVSTTVSSGSPKNQSVVWQDELMNGDFIEAFIESVDGTDIQVNTATLRIN